jgi:elongation factor G
MADDHPQKALYEIRRIWERGNGPSSCGWRAVEKRLDGTEVPIADFVSYRDALEWLDWKSGLDAKRAINDSSNSDPQPCVIEVAIEPKSQPDREKLGVALAKLAAEDPSFRVSTDQESGRTILKGFSETHLDALLDTLKRTYPVEVYIGVPQVAYRETISKQVTEDYTHKKQIGGSGQFARVKIVLDPLPPGSGVMFENKVVGGNVPKEYLPGVEKGLESVLGSGVLAGFPVVDLKVTLIDGAYHDVDSSALAFEIAARAALKEALREAGPILLEPIMKVEVVTPEEYAGVVIADLKTRRGRILDQDKRGDANVVNAMVPLANMFGYVNNLRSMSQGRATFTMRFDHYALVPSPDDDPPFRPAMGMRA